MYSYNIPVRMIPNGDMGFTYTIHRHGDGSAGDGLDVVNEDNDFLSYQNFGGAFAQDGHALYPDVKALTDWNYLFLRPTVTAQEVYRFNDQHEEMWSLVLYPEWEETLAPESRYLVQESQGGDLYLSYMYEHEDLRSMALWHLSEDGEILHSWNWDTEDQLSFEPILMRLGEAGVVYVLGREVREEWNGTEWVQIPSTTLLTLEAVTGIGSQDPIGMPRESHIVSAWPNPFNDQMRVEFRLDRAGQPSLKMYDLLGREVWTAKDLPGTAGEHQFMLRPGHLASGVYLLRLETGAVTDTRKVLYLR